ncbi:hypothetical protein Ancab_019495 [Ancistrocladus abbreviatus]
MKISNIMNYRTYLAQFILARRYMADGPGNTAAKTRTLKNAFDWLSNKEEAGGSDIDMEQIMSNQVGEDAIHGLIGIGWKAAWLALGNNEVFGELRMK